MTSEIGHHVEKRRKEMGGGGSQEWYNLQCESIIDLSKIYQMSNSPQCVTITFWYAETDTINANQTERDYDTSTHWEASSPNVIFDGGDLGYSDVESEYYSKSKYTSLYIGDENPDDYYTPYEHRGNARFRSKSYTFNIRNLSEDELKTGWIKVTPFAQIHGTDGGKEDGGSGPYHIATVEDKIDSCDIYGHDYVVKNAADQVWSSDYSTLKLTYTCDNNIKHDKYTATVKTTATKSADGKRITYTAVGSKGEGYTKIVSSEAGNDGATATVKLSQAVTADHSPVTDADSSDSIVYPGGSKSSSIYKQSDSSIKFTLANQIPAGTQKVQFSYYYSEDLKDLTIVILNSRGKIIGQGGMSYTNTFNKPSNGYVTIPLINNSDDDLSSSTVRITAAAYTQNYSSPSSTPATAHSKVGVTQMKLYF